MKREYVPSFFAAKFCAGKKGCCGDMRVMQFNFGGIYYKVCVADENCSLKSVVPVKARQSDVYVQV